MSKTIRIPRLRPMRIRVAHAVAALSFCAAPAAHAGLDITAYGGLTIVNAPAPLVDGLPQAEDQVLFSPGDFPERFAGLESGTVYQFAESFDFRAGSYSGYNWWRNELAKLAGYPPRVSVRKGKTERRYDVSAWARTGGPFWELINFSDAEGVIGPQVCRRVRQDFARYADKAARHPDEDFRESYADWRKAFDMCANHGAIVFH